MEQKKHKPNKNLPKFINEAITSIIDYGDNSSATKHLESYKTSIAGKTTNTYFLYHYTHTFIGTMEISQTL